jgi:hypothetical protein
VLERSYDSQIIIRKRRNRYTCIVCHLAIRAPRPDKTEGFYTFSRQGVVVLSNDLKEKHIDLPTSIFDRKRDFKARTGIIRADGYQKMKYIELREYILNEKMLVVQICSAP